MSQAIYRNVNALPAGFKIHWYEVDSVLGQGGFGITYLARDTNLNQRVAIKEFLPTELATRSADATVHPLTRDHQDTYGWGLDRFLSEAQTLARFRHPNIVRVLSVFEQNNTAYMVMEYENGRSLGHCLRFGDIRGEVEIRRILLASMDGLEKIHEAGFIHRDIKPDNIFMRDDGTPVLLDFGSARQAIGTDTRTLTALVTPGFAPYEQYGGGRDDDRQGPWTDIYGLGATFYKAITGTGPIDAMVRVNAILDGGADPLRPCAELAEGRYGPGLLHGIDRALAFYPKDRPQSIAQWRQIFGVADAQPEPATGGPVTLGFDAGDPITQLPAGLAGPTQVADTGPVTSDTATSGPVTVAPATVPGPEGRLWPTVAALSLAIVAAATTAGVALLRPDLIHALLTPTAPVASGDLPAGLAPRAGRAASDPAPAGPAPVALPADHSPGQQPGADAGRRQAGEAVRRAEEWTQTERLRQQEQAQTAAARRERERLATSEAGHLATQTAERQALISKVADEAARRERERAARQRRQQTPALPPATPAVDPRELARLAADQTARRERAARATAAGQEKARAVAAQVDELLRLEAMEAELAALRARNPGVTATRSSGAAKLGQDERLRAMLRGKTLFGFNPGGYSMFIDFYPNGQHQTQIPDHNITFDGGWSVRDGRLCLEGEMALQGALGDWCRQVVSVDANVLTLRGAEGLTKWRIGS